MLDIDGTIVDREGTLPAEVRSAVWLAVDAGVPVLLATGRSWHGTRDVIDALGLPTGPTVCSNGAVVVSYPPEQIVRAITFQPGDVIRKVQQVAPKTLIAVEEIGRGYRVNNHFPFDDLTGEVVVQDVAELSARPVTRVILRDPTGSDADFVRLAANLGLHGVSYFVGWSAWLDIAPEGVNKASALAEVVLSLDIHASQVLAFGDGRNDIEMLRWAGRGVAIGDAPPEVQAAADAVAAPFAAGGPVQELRRWFG